jgi:hypothetical protein
LTRLRRAKHLLRLLDILPLKEEAGPEVGPVDRGSVDSTADVRLGTAGQPPLLSKGVAQRKDVIGGAGFGHIEKLVKALDKLRDGVLLARRKVHGAVAPGDAFTHRHLHSGDVGTLMDQSNSTLRRADLPGLDRDTGDGHLTRLWTASLTHEQRGVDGGKIERNRRQGQLGITGGGRKDIRDDDGMVDQELGGSILTRAFPFGAAKKVEGRTNTHLDAGPTGGRRRLDGLQNVAAAGRNVGVEFLDVLRESSNIVEGGGETQVSHYRRVKSACQVRVHRRSHKSAFINIGRQARSARMCRESQHRVQDHRVTIGSLLQRSDGGEGRRQDEVDVASAPGDRRKDGRIGGARGQTATIKGDITREGHALDGLERHRLHVALDQGVDELGRGGENRDAGRSASDHINVPMGGSVTGGGGGGRDAEKLGNTTGEAAGDGGVGGREAAQERVGALEEGGTRTGDREGIATLGQVIGQDDVVQLQVLIGESLKEARPGQPSIVEHHDTSAPLSDGALTRRERSGGGARQERLEVPQQLLTQHLGPRVDLQIVDGGALSEQLKDHLGEFEGLANTGGTVQTRDTNVAGHTSL